MSGLETAPSQEFRDELDDFIRRRIRDARVIADLSPGREDKLLQLLEEKDGSRFVARSFSMDAIRHVEDCGRAFEEAWEAMQEIFVGADIPLVRTGIAINDQSRAQEYPIVMVSEYLQDYKPLEAASTETKVELAGKLPGLFAKSNGLMLSSATMRYDMFGVVTDDAGDEQVVMLDVDPLLTRPLMNIADPLEAAYIERLSEHMWDSWCKPEEREEVISAFVKSVSMTLGAKLDNPGSPLMRKFTNAHMMAQGIDLREFGKAF